MNQKDELLTKSRSLISTIVNHPTNPLPLDYSESSLKLVQSFVASLKNDSLSEIYVGRMLLTMAVYLGDILLKNFPDAEYEFIFSEDQVDDILFKYGDNKLFLLSMMKKAMIDSEGADISLKYPFLIKQLEGILSLE